MRKQLRVRGRESLVAKAMGLVSAGSSLDVVGDRWSGRTAFLRELSSRLEAAGWRTVPLRGVDPLRDHPYAALHLADIGWRGPARERTGIQLAVAALRERVSARGVVIVVDDWDDLDEGSWGVIAAVEREVGLPVVRARLLGHAGRCAPGETARASIDPGLEVELGPVPLQTLEAIVGERLGDPVELATTSRIHEKSGGNVGLALGIVEAALSDGLLVRTDGFWTADGDLWSPSLRGMALTRLTGLPPASREALDIVARVGTAELSTVRRLVEWSALEDLEERGLLRLLGSGLGPIVKVSPPLLADFLRHEERSLRRVRQAELVAERLGSGSAELRLLQHEPRPPMPDGEQDALLSGLLADRARARRVVTGAEWEKAPGPETAVRYLDALVSAGADRAEVERVLLGTDLYSGVLSDRIELVRFSARWRAVVHRDLDGALALLERHAAVAGRHAPLLEAERVALVSHIRGIPDGWEDRLALTGDEPAAVLSGVLEVRLLLLFALGRFGDAMSAYQRIDAVEHGEVSAPARLYGELARACDHDYERALARLSSALETATEELDIGSMRVYGSGLTSLLVLGGDYTGAERVLRRVFALGDPPPLPLGVGTTIVGHAALIAFRRGDDALGSRRVAALDRLGAECGLLSLTALLPDQRPGAEADPAREADALWQCGDRAWRRGARTSAALAMLGSLELEDTAERRRTALDRTGSLGGRIVGSARRFALALSDDDPEEALAASAALEEAGRYGLAIDALRLAAVRFHGRGLAARAAQAAASEEALRLRLRPRDIETARFATQLGDLSERQREIARLAASGLSNQEIATDLVISVRTVESHMYHSLRKLGLGSRQSLRYYADVL